jgi:serine/threonine protein kinase
MGMKYVGSSADIWSLGVILFAMVSGFLPFEAPSLPALYHRIRHRLFVRPDFLTPECGDLLDRMLTIDPEQRATLSDIRNHPWCVPVPPRAGFSPRRRRRQWARWPMA